MARKIEVAIVGDSSSLQRAFRSASSSSSGFTRSLGTLGKAAGLVAGGAAIGGLVGVLRAGIPEWTQSQKVAAQTAAVLKSTGGVANVTAKQVDSLAQSLLAKTGVDDEQIKAGENWLLTFKNVRNEMGAGNDIFNQATKAALDLAVAQANAKGGSVDMAQASNLLGKALNDPVKGLTALTRVGVTFDEAQKEQIKSLVKAGETMEAQKIILGELTSQVGGSAEAMGKTLPGQIAIARESFNNLAGSLVGALAPAFATGLNAANDFIRKFSEADGAAAKFKVVTDTIKTAAVAAGEGVVKAFRSIDWNEVGRFLADGFRDAVDFLSRAIRAINWGELGSQVGRFVVLELNKLDEWISRVDWNEAGRALIQGISQAIKALAQFLAGVDWKAVLGAYFNHMMTFLRSLGSLLLGIGTELGGKIVDGVTAGLSRLGPLVWAQVLKLPGLIADAAKFIYGYALSLGGRIVDGVIDGLADLGSRVKDKIQSALSWSLSDIDIPGFSPPEAAAAKAIGKPLADGTIIGWIEGTRRLPDEITDVLRNALEKAQQQISDARSGLTDSFSRLSGDALAAFDANSQQVLDGLAARFDRLKAQIDANLADTLARLDERQGQLTAAEKAIARREEGRADTLRQRALDDARAALAEARAGGDPEAILNAQRQLKDAQYQITLASLQERAQKEREALDAAVALQRQKATEKANAAKAGLDKQYQDELLNTQAILATQRRHFEDSLSELGKALEKRGNRAAEAHEAILDLFDKFGVNFEAVGHNMGVAWIRGLRESILAAAKDAGGLKAALEGAIEDLKPLPVLKPKRPTSGTGPFGAGDVIPSGPIGPGAASLDSGLWDEYALAQATIQNWQNLGTYNPASRLPSGAPSDHAKYPAKAFDAGFSPATGWDNSSARDFFMKMIGRAGIHYVILGDKIWSRESGLHHYGYGGHMNHVHVSGYDRGGWLMPGLTLAMNNTGRPERVTPPGGAVPVNVNVTVNGVVATSSRELARTLAPDIVDEINNQQGVGRLRFAT